jgi:hypothetical protein
MLSTAQEAIRYADTKLGLLLTAVAVTAPTLQDHVLWLTDRWNADSLRAVATVVVGGTGVTLMAAAVAFTASGLMPRLHRPPPVDPQAGRELNRFAWPTLTNATAAELTALPNAEVRAEAARQLIALSGIASRKFRRFAIGLGCAVVGSAAVVLSGLVGHDFVPRP